MSDYLPDRLILEILCRLPVESIIRCMCVCKQWCCLISSSHFINTHLSYSLSATSLLLIHHYTTTPNYKLHHTVYLDNPSTTQLNILKKLHIPFESIPQLKIQFRALGFCNGLFCYIDDLFGETNAFVLWNPSIRKSLSLPIPPTGSLDQNVPCKFYHGFGVDPKTREFKVVRIAYKRKTYNAYAVEVYSLGTGLWRTLNTMDIHSKVVQSFGATNVCLNGTIYWVSCIKNNESGSFFNSLLLFDLSNETFSEMCLPPGLVHVDPLNLHVALCGERDQLHDRPYNRCVV